MDDVVGQLFGLQVLVTALASRFANQQTDPEQFLREIRGEALMGVRRIDYETNADTERVRAAAERSVNELLDLLVRGRTA